MSRISLTAVHQAAAIIRNRIPLILRFYLRRKIGGPTDRPTDRTSSLPLRLFLSLPCELPLCNALSALAITNHHRGGDTVATNYELTLRLATVPSERGNDVPSFVSGETKVIKPRGLLDNLAYVPRYVPGLTIVRCWRALRSQPSVGKFIEFLSPLSLSFFLQRYSSFARHVLRNIPVAWRNFYSLRWNRFQRIEDTMLRFLPGDRYIWNNSIEIIEI